MPRIYAARTLEEDTGGVEGGWDVMIAAVGAVASTISGLKRMNLQVFDYFAHRLANSIALRVADTAHHVFDEHDLNFYTFLACFYHWRLNKRGECVCLFHLAHV